MAVGFTKLALPKFGSSIYRGSDAAQQIHIRIGGVLGHCHKLWVVWGVCYIRTVQSNTWAQGGSL